MKTEIKVILLKAKGCQSLPVNHKEPEDMNRFSLVVNRSNTWILTASLWNYETINVCGLSHSVYGTWLWKP